MRKDLPPAIAKIDLNIHPLADTLKTLIQVHNTANPQNINSTKADSYAAHIYIDLFGGKETNYIFFLTLAKLLCIASMEVEKKFGVDIPHAVIPKSK